MSDYYIPASAYVHIEPNYYISLSNYQQTVNNVLCTYLTHEFDSETPTFYYGDIKTKYDNVIVNASELTPLESILADIDSLSTHFHDYSVNNVIDSSKIINSLQSLFYCTCKIAKVRYTYCETFDSETGAITYSTASALVLSAKQYYLYPNYKICAHLSNYIDPQWIIRALQLSNSISSLVYCNASKECLYDYNIVEIVETYYGKSTLVYNEKLGPFPDIWSYWAYRDHILSQFSYPLYTDVTYTQEPYLDGGIRLRIYAKKREYRLKLNLPFSINTYLLHEGVPPPTMYYSINCFIPSEQSSCGYVDGKMSNIKSGDSSTLSAIEFDSAYTREVYPFIPLSIDLHVGLFDHWYIDDGTTSTISILTLTDINRNINLSAYFISNPELDIISDYLSDLVLMADFDNSSSLINSVSSYALSSQNMSQKYMLRGINFSAAMPDSTLSIIYKNIEDGCTSVGLVVKDDDWTSTEIDIRDSGFPLSSTAFFISCNYDNIGQIWHIPFDDNLTYITYNTGITSSLYLVNELLSDDILDRDSIIDVKIGNAVTSIGKEAFKDCTMLTNIAFTNNVVRIDDDAFSNCISLRNIDIPYSISLIGSNAFNGCTATYLTFVERTVDDISLMDNAYWGLDESQCIPGITS